MELTLVKLDNVTFVVLGVERVDLGSLFSSQDVKVERAVVLDFLVERTVRRGAYSSWKCARDC